MSIDTKRNQTKYLLKIIQPKSRAWDKNLGVDIYMEGNPRSESEGAEGETDKGAWFQWPSQAILKKKCLQELSVWNMGIFIHHLPVPITWSLSLASLISGMLHNKFLWHWKRHWGKWEKMWCLLEMGHCRCKISVRLPKTIHCGWSWNQMWAGRIDVVIRGLWYTKESRRPLTNALGLRWDIQV